MAFANYGNYKGYSAFNLDLNPLFSIYLPTELESYQNLSIGLNLGNIEIPYDVLINGILENGSPIIKNNLNELKEKLDWIVNPIDYNSENLTVEINEPIVEQQVIKQKPVKNNKEVKDTVGTNRFTQSPLYKWDGKNRISKSSTAKNMMDIYKSMNIPSHIASAIIGHIYAESGFNSIKRNPNDAGQVSTGLILWDLNRLKKLKEFAKSKNKSWSDISTQLEFILYEMKNYYPKYYNDLMSSTTPAEATEAMAGYILFAGWNGSTNTARRSGWSLSRINSEHKNRLNYAQEIYRNWGY